MEKIIAIRKESRLASLALQNASTEEKRTALVERAITSSERSQNLIEQGFQPVQLPLSDDEAFRRPAESEPSFTRLGYLGAYIVNAPEGLEAQAVSALENDYYLLPNLELSLPTNVSLNEPPSSPQKRRKSPWSKESGVKTAHDEGFTGSGVIVGVLDTGCDSEHSEFKKRSDVIEFVFVNASNPNELRRNRPAFDIEDHGTHVSGIVAGKTLGVAPDVDLMVASVLIGTEEPKTTLERIIVGLDWMLERFRDSQNRNKPMIINMSLGIAKAAMETIYQAQNIQLKRIFDTLLEDYDVLPIVAIGNEGRDNIRAPGYYASTLSVGAVNSKLEPAEFTSYGISPDTQRTQPDLVGYGVSVYSSVARNVKRSLYQTKSGTSMAAPYVTGIAALYASEDPTLKGNALREKLLKTALPLSADPEKVGKGLARYVKGGSK